MLCMNGKNSSKNKEVFHKFPLYLFNKKEQLHVHITQSPQCNQCDYTIQRPRFPVRFPVCHEQWQSQKKVTPFILTRLCTWTWTFQSSYHIWFPTNTSRINASNEILKPFLVMCRPWLVLPLVISCCWNQVEIVARNKMEHPQVECI